MSLPVSGHLSLPILILTGIPSLCCHLNRLIYVIFKSLSHLRQPQLSAAPLKREHQVAVCCSCNPGQISLMPLWAGRAGGSRGQSPAGTVAPCPPRWGMPRKTRPALLGASLLADNGQWRQNRKCFLLNWSSCTPNCLLTNLLPKEFQVLFLYSETCIILTEEIIILPLK